MGVENGAVPHRAEAMVIRRLHTTDASAGSVALVLCPRVIGKVRRNQSKSRLLLTIGVMVGASLSGLACGAPDDDQHVPSVMRRDSAGISIVESASPRWGGSARWTVKMDPVLDLTTTGPGPAHEFSEVEGAMRLEDGSFVVADEGAKQVRFFSSAGSFEAAVGRDGEAPGEFRRVTAVERFRGDSLIVFDRRLRRASVVSPTWDIARVITPEEHSWRAQEWHVLDDRTFVIMAYPPSFRPAREGHFRLKQPVVRLAANLDVIDTVTTVPGYEANFILPFGTIQPLFFKTGHLATYESRIYVGSADLLQYQVFSQMGRLERIVRVPRFDLRLSSAANTAEREALLDAIPPNRHPEFVAQYTAALNDLPDSETRAAYSTLLVDHLGAVWAIEAQGVSERDQLQKAQVFDSEGVWLGTVHLPAGYIVFEIGIDYLLGKQIEEDGLERLQMLRLMRS